MSGRVYLLEGVANAIFSTEDILKAIGDLPRLELKEESDTDEESEGISYMGRI
jgi:hypothetical protein